MANSVQDLTNHSTLHKTGNLRSWLASGWQAFVESRKRLIYGSLVANTLSLAVLISFRVAYSAYPHRSSFGYLLLYGTLSWGLSAGWFLYCLDYSRGTQASISRLFVGLTRPVVVALGFVLFLIDSVALNLLFIFGLFAVGRYAYTFYLVKDFKATLIEAIKRSAAITKGRRLQLGFLYVMANVPNVFIILSLPYQKSDLLDLLIITLWLTLFTFLLSPWFGASLAKSYSDLSNYFETNSESSRIQSRFAVMKTVVFAALSLALILMLTFPQVPAMFAYRQRFKQNQYPILYETPVTRTLDASKSSRPADAEHVVGDLAFEINGKKPIHQRDTGRMVRLDFPGNRSLIFRQSEFLLSDGLLEDIIPNPETRRKVFGNRFTSLGYSALDTILSTSPRDNDRNFERTTALLVLKIDVIPTTTDYRMHRFETNTIRGFQFGRPNKSEFVACFIYDNGGLFYEYHFRNFSQAEIDFTLSSVRNRDK